MSGEEAKAEASEELAGQVVHKRSVSSKLCFYDLIITTSNKHEERISVALKAWICGQEVLDRARKGNDTERIHVGDVIRFKGKTSEEENFQATDFKIVRSFKEHNPGKTFSSIPPPVKDNGKRVRKPCKFWLNTGRCPREDGCPYEHNIEDRDIKVLRKEQVDDKIKRKAELQDNHGDVDLKSRHRRASIFAEWLLKEFADCFSDGSKCVVDVAGGKGELAFELKVRLGAKSRVVIVDPRVKDEGLWMAKWQRKMLAKLEKKSGRPVEMPEKRQALFNGDLIKQLGNVRYPI